MRFMHMSALDEQDCLRAARLVSLAIHGGVLRRESDKIRRTVFQVFETYET